MGAYILRRLLLVVPTLLGIILINFFVVQFAPGGPVEQMLAELRGEGQTLGRLTGEGGGETPRPAAARQVRRTGSGGRSAATAARAGSTRRSSREIERDVRLRQAARMAASWRCCRATCPSTSAAACSATGRWWT